MFGLTGLLKWLTEGAGVKKSDLMRFCLDYRAQLVSLYLVSSDMKLDVTMFNWYLN